MTSEIAMIIKENEGLIYSIATKFYNNDIEDLYQQGVIGIIKAYRNYKMNEETKFSTFAYKYIFGEMYLYSVKNKGIKINKETLKLYKSIIKVQDFLTQKLGKIPSTTEISLYLELEEELVSEVLLSGEIILSLDSKQNLSLYDNIPSSTNNKDEKIDISDSINKLREDERKIIQYRYFDDYTQSEVAKKLKMTQVMVSRYEKKSLQKLRQYIA